MDDAEYAPVTAQQRAEAEKEIRKRERREALASGRQRPGLLYDESEEEDEDGSPVPKRRQKPSSEEVGEETLEVIENLEDLKGHSVREWVSMPSPRLEIKNRFKSFLKSFFDESDSLVYVEKIKRMAEGEC